MNIVSLVNNSVVDDNLKVALNHLLKCKGVEVKEASFRAGLRLSLEVNSSSNLLVASTPKSKLTLGEAVELILEKRLSGKNSFSFVRHMGRRSSFEWEVIRLLNKKTDIMAIYRCLRGFNMQKKWEIEMTPISSEKTFTVKISKVA